jgi:hypothetical protein
MQGSEFNTQDHKKKPRIYKELKELNTQRTNNPINKWASEMNR